MEREDPFALHALVLGGLRRVGDNISRQSRQVLLLVDHQLKIVGLAQDILAECQLEHGDALVQLAQLGLIGLREVGAAAYEALISQLEQFLLLLVEVHLSLVVVNRLHAGEQLRIQADVVRVLGKQGIYLLLQRLDLLGGIDARLTAESVHHLVQQLAALVQSDNRILESGRIRIVDDRVDLILVLLHSPLERRLVVRDLDLVERRHPIRCRIFREERIRGGIPITTTLPLGGTSSHDNG